MTNNDLQRHLVGLESRLENYHDELTHNLVEDRSRLAEELALARGQLIWPIMLGLGIYVLTTFDLHAFWEAVGAISIAVVSLGVTGLIVNSEEKRLKARTTKPPEWRHTDW
ncbi:hypothetical protein [Qipengyuania sp. S6317L1]|uniref:hypothetical protein n=1 Tax=Qipengyuania sp. S6317L1 TaxID=2926410 RepID=UPI001FF45871|nr:hypothetical protein [Qipengyuania sp. S6317L1]